MQLAPINISVQTINPSCAVRIRQQPLCRGNASRYGYSTTAMREMKRTGGKVWA